MEKRAVAAVFLLLLVGMLILAGIEAAAKFLGGTSLMILCYLVIGAALGGYLIKMKKEERNCSKNGDVLKDRGSPENEKGEEEDFPEKNSGNFGTEGQKGKKDDNV